MFIGDNAYEKENDGSLISTDINSRNYEPFGTCGEGAEYTLDENGTLTITGNGSIDFGAFRGFGKEDDKRVIKKVVISSGMIGIGNFAFENCSDLKSVEIPASVSSIGSAAF